MRAALTLAGALAAAACHPYDPDLGARPFLCGIEAPRCPDGYTPVDVTTNRCECQLGADLPDAGPAYACNPDMYEPNDGLAMAKVSVVGVNGNVAQNFRDIAVCPATDVDLFQFSTATPNTLVKVTVNFDLTRQPPDIDLLDDGGVSLHPQQGSTLAGEVIATQLEPRLGRYYVRMSGTLEVNYSVRLEIIPPQ
jgi:hypothetical protein